MKSVMVVGAVFALIPSTICAQSRFIPPDQFRAHIEKSGISLPSITTQVCNAPTIKLAAYVDQKGKISQVKEWKNENSLLRWPKAAIEVAKKIARSITLRPFKIDGSNAKIWSVVEFPCTQQK